MFTTQKILFVVNVPEFFLSHRLPLATAAKSLGYEVHVATASAPGVDIIREHGFECHDVPFARSGQNPFNEIKTLLRLIKVCRYLQPDLVHLVTIKPVLYGGLAARVTGIKATVAAVSGLGTVFLPTSLFGRFRRWFVTRLYSAALKQKRLSVIFQNPDDRDTLLSAGVLSHSVTRLIRGSGVALSDYRSLPEPTGRPVVVMAARLLKDKGVFEFVEAAKVLRERNVNVLFRLVGRPDPGNPTSISEEDFSTWKKEGLVDVMGYRSDIAEIFSSAHIVALPSYYGEGLPKVLMEAAACGRAVVTTDHPGCRDAIEPGVSGVLVPIRDTVALAGAIERLATDHQARQAMGQAGRALAEREFAIEKIVEQHMAIYKELENLV